MLNSYDSLSLACLWLAANVDVIVVPSRWALFIAGNFLVLGTKKDTRVEEGKNREKIRRIEKRGKLFHSSKNINC